MKKGTECIGLVERIEFPNKGIVMVDDEKIIVKNAITGQKVRFVVNKVRKGKSEGRLLEVVEKSSLETKEAVCSHFGDCGGCTYQTIPYETQIKIKADQVKKLIDEVIATDNKEYEFQGIEGSPLEFGYRNKMEFSFGDEFKDGPLALGLHKKGSFYDIVTTSDCKLVHEDYNRILGCVLSLAKEYNLNYYHKMSHEGYLRHLLIRRAARTGEILVSLITTSQTNVLVNGEEEFLNKLRESLKNLSLEGSIVGILHTVNDSLADVVQSDRTDILDGQDFIFEEVLGLKFKISTFSFFQTNSLGAEVLYNCVRDFVGETKDKLIFDLYSGTGTIAQLLAPVAKKVIGVEIVGEAVVAARENASLNKLTNCEFIAGDVLKVIDTIEEKPDLIVLDPPRDGIHPKALDKIIDYGVDRLVYISCKPSSLARDLVVLQERGYWVEKVRCVDMFPCTVHTETVCLLNRTK
ncbi:23S rRNA (uracil(1939)-C(5))-methyltransferase RlmD [Lachnoclostridium phytofermentans]|uniref:RNA methyltransferase, TrmA family n=1 Tax=Lachnoclostridium phytofermentans (strain ATCC 700394 / DSM 18823 / ISDg) TaxID=357809 RepID=A9KP69_LACP7|nr:23S rRNA (uracil(1939)-C(5))-methyltransferase RlmD [Lachnoclostridium phytofermentans]ABX41731.1 RNA methyltransferase, TrmA family [Lachnoclostridium phytofermentans ISDg]